MTPTKRQEDTFAFRMNRIRELCNLLVYIAQDLHKMGFDSHGNQATKISDELFQRMRAEQKDHG